jgi:hypothetical protein
VWGSGCIDLCFLDLGINWRWLVGFTYRPLHCWGKSPRYPLQRWLSEPHSRSGRSGEVTITDQAGTRTPTPRMSSQQPVAVASYRGSPLYICNNTEPHFGQMNSPDEVALESLYSVERWGLSDQLRVEWWGLSDQLRVEWRGLSDQLRVERWGLSYQLRGEWWGLSDQLRVEWWGLSDQLRRIL